MREQPLIWVVEDDEGVRFVYSEILSIRYEVRFFENFKSFMTALSEAHECGTDRPDLIIADMRLPDGVFLKFMLSDEFKFVSTVPIMIVSSVDDSDILRSCFDRGVADYLTKPFNKSELLVKIQRMLPGSKRGIGSEVQIDPHFLRLISRNGQSIKLTPKEFQIFSTLRLGGDRGILKQDILTQVWDGVNVDARVLDVHIFNLRRKLSDLGLRIEVAGPECLRIAADD